MSYSTEAELTAYATARGVTITGDPAVLLQKANDYIELQTYKGSRTDTTQTTAWPRYGVYVDGILQDIDTVPQGIKNAEMITALIYDAGGDPVADREPRVTSETIFGAVAVTYGETGATPTVYNKLNMTLAPYLSSGAGGFSVSR